VAFSKPVVLQKVPDMQARHTDKPLMGANVPRGHAVPTLEPRPQKAPAGQGCDAALLPPAHRVPGGHSAVPKALFSPARQ